MIEPPVTKLAQSDPVEIQDLAPNSLEIRVNEKTKEIFWLWFPGRCVSTHAHLQIEGNHCIYVVGTKTVLKSKIDNPDYNKVPLVKIGLQVSEEEFNALREEFEPDAPFTMSANCSSSVSQLMRTHTDQHHIPVFVGLSPLCSTLYLLGKKIFCKIRGTESYISSIELRGKKWKAIQWVPGICLEASLIFNPTIQTIYIMSGYLTVGNAVSYTKHYYERLKNCVPFPVF